jgi:hypothetical protein
MKEEAKSTFKIVTGVPVKKIPQGKFGVDERTMLG